MWWHGWEITSRLTHWDRVTHKCVNKLTIIRSDNGMSPGRRQVFIWTIAGIWLIGFLGTNFSKILIEIQTFSLNDMQFILSSATWRTFCPGLNVLIVRMYSVTNPSIGNCLSPLLWPCRLGYRDGNRWRNGPDSLMVAGWGVWCSDYDPYLLHRILESRYHESWV